MGRDKGGQYHHQAEGLFFFDDGGRAGKTEEAVPLFIIHAPRTHRTFDDGGTAWYDGRGQGKW
jgi:hypothetical protein